MYGIYQLSEFSLFVTRGGRRGGQEYEIYSLQAQTSAAQIAPSKTEEPKGPVHRRSEAITQPVMGKYRLTSDRHTGR